MLFLCLSTQINLHHVLKMSAVGIYACFQSWIPLVNGCVNCTLFSRLVVGSWYENRGWRWSYNWWFFFPAYNCCSDGWWCNSSKDVQAGCQHLLVWVDTIPSEQYPLCCHELILPKHDRHILLLKKNKVRTDVLIGAAGRIGKFSQ